MRHAGTDDSKPATVAHWNGGGTLESRSRRCDRRRRLRRACAYAQDRSPRNLGLAPPTLPQSRTSSTPTTAFARPRCCRFRTEAATPLEREATRLLTIAFVLRPSRASRSPWRHSGRPDSAVRAPRRALPIAQQQSSYPPRRDGCLCHDCDQGGRHEDVAARGAIQECQRTAREARTTDGAERDETRRVVATCVGPGATPACVG